ncbi:MIP/aquaporin family protein [Streptomyces sp. NPDC001530]|uniref:MIP/aquaporin family protein n=1 Tax=Streptomyces sp. NPDC001530 TaxID=3364582 RepID=UPI0036983224
MTTSTRSVGPPSGPSTRAARRPAVLWAAEFAATALMLLAMTLLFRHLFHPGAWLHARLASGDRRLLADALVSGAVVAALVASPLGRVSGAHMNPAVTVALWAARHLPGRQVPLYLSAQLVGSATGTGVGRFLAGPAVAHPDVNYALLKPVGEVPGAVVAIGEAIATGILLVVVVRQARDPALGGAAPVTVGGLLAALIACTAHGTGGSLNPAQQFGPWLLAGAPGSLWPYVVGPLAAALVIGAAAAALTGPADRDRFRW